MFRWTEPLIRQAKDKGIDVIDVRGPEVNQKTVQGKLEAVKPGLVLLNGHGDENTYCGHDFQKVIDSDSVGTLSGTITYVRACDCLEGLGEAAVEKGCKTFIGYTDEFLIPITDEFSATPLRDPAAIPVMEASNAIMKHLIDGKTPQVAVENSKKATKEYVKKIIYSKEYAEDNRFGDTLFALVTNYGSLGIKE